MADPFSILLSSANQYAKDEYARDPYVTSAAQLGGVKQFSSPWATLLGTLGSGLVGGVYQGLAEENLMQNRQKALDVLEPIYNAPYGSPQLRSSYNTMDMKDPLRPFAQELLVAKKIEHDKLMKDAADYALDIAKAGEVATSTELGKLKAYGVTPKGTDISALSPLAEVNRKISKEGMDARAALRNNIYSQPAVREFLLANSAAAELQSAVSAAKGGDKLADTQILYKVIGVLDPGSAVRGEDINTTLANIPMAAALKAKAMNVLEGGSFDDATRNALLRIGERALKARSVTLAPLIEDFRKEARRSAIDEDVIPDFTSAFVPRSPLTPPPPPTIGPDGAQRVKVGVSKAGLPVYRKPDGTLEEDDS